MTIAYVKKTLGYALKQGAKDDLPTMKRRIACAKNHMCGNHSECNLFFPGNCHALHQKEGSEHKPALPYGRYFINGLPAAVESSWTRVTTDAMLKQCLHEYNTQGNEACNNSFTNCEQPKSRCQFVGTNIHNFRAAMFAARQTIGFRGLIHGLQQSGVDATKDQLAMADVLEYRADKKKEWQASTHGKAIRKHKANAKSIQQVRDEASELISPTYQSAGFGGGSAANVGGDGGGGGQA